MLYKEGLQILKQSIICFDFSSDIENAMKLYPSADSIKFRVVFKTNTFDWSVDYDSFKFCDTSDILKEIIVNYLTESMLKDNIQADYDLDIYVSIDAFISKEHDSNDECLNIFDIIDGRTYDDCEGNTWITTKCYTWMLGYEKPIESFWQFGHKPVVLPYA